MVVVGMSHIAVARGDLLVFVVVVNILRKIKLQVTWSINTFVASHVALSLVLRIQLRQMTLTQLLNSLLLYFNRSILSRETSLYHCDITCLDSMA